MSESNETGKKMGFVVLREALGFSMQDICEIFHVSRTTVWNWERGRIPNATQQKIRAYFDLPLGLNLDGSVSEDEQRVIRNCALRFLQKEISSGQAQFIGAGRRRLFAETAQPPVRDESTYTEYGLEVDRVLGQVKRAFLRDVPSDDPRIRIMVDALHLMMDQWDDQHKDAGE